MNLSSSFDHRFVDGYDAAAMIQAEGPAGASGDDFHTQGEDPMTAQPQRPTFGSLLTSHMAAASYRDGEWSAAEIKPVAPIELSPAAHVLHYASTCFEGSRPSAGPTARFISFAWIGTSSACVRALACWFCRNPTGAARRNGA